EGQADQDRREGGEPRPLCYLPDGRGRHRTANVPRDFAADRGATAAATTSASVRRSMSCIQSNRQKECVQMPGKMARSDPRPSVRVTRGAGSGQHLASVLQEAGKTRTLMRVWDSSGESRFRGFASLRFSTFKRKWDAHM